MRGLQIDPTTYFEKVVYSGNHERLIDMVLGGEVDAGATYSAAYKLAGIEHSQGKRLKIIAKVGRIPSDAYCASPRLDQQLIEQIRDALLRLSTRQEVGRQVLSGLTGINGFVSVGDAHYDDVRRVARTVERFQ